MKVKKGMFTAEYQEKNFRLRNHVLRHMEKVTWPGSFKDGLGKLLSIAL